MKVCDFYVTNREKYQKEKLDEKRKWELMKEEGLRQRELRIITHQRRLRRS